MHPTRFVLAAGAVGVAAIACACGTLLGVDDVGYAGSPDAAIDSAALDATVDAPAEAGGGDAGDGDAADARFEAADGDAAVDARDAAFTCVGSTALLCADFEGPDPTAAYLNGVLGNGVFIVDTTATAPSLVLDRTGMAVKLDVPALATSGEAGHCALKFQSSFPGASHRHIEMDAKMNIAPSDETGSANIFAVQFPSITAGCVFFYVYGNRQASIYRSCDGVLAGLAPFPGPFAGAWTHLTMDVTLSAGNLTFGFTNGNGGAAVTQPVTGTLDDVVLLLGGSDDQGPAPAKDLLIDNVVMGFE